MSNFCLVRHGQTDWNIQGRWQGFSDQPLNATGLQQAEQVALALAEEHFDAVYSSDLWRARETARIIASSHHLDVTTDPRLREINMGAWEGFLGVDVPVLFPDSWAQRQSFPATSRPPGGESLIDLSNRVLAVMADLSGQHPTGRVLIVAHGLSLAVFLCHIRSIPLEQAFDNIPKNARPTWVEWFPSVA